jgi:hypothetical protein
MGNISDSNHSNHREKNSFKTSEIDTKKLVDMTKSSKKREKEQIGKQRKGERRKKRTENRQ